MKFLFLAFLLSLNILANTSTEEVIDEQDSLSRGRISLNGTGISYSSVSGTTYYIGALYEYPLTAKLLAGAGASASFNSYRKTYGPQASMKYYFNTINQDGLFLTSGADYTWKNYKNSDSIAKFSLAGGGGYQWVYGEHNNLSFALGWAASTNEDRGSNGFINFGFAI